MESVKKIVLERFNQLKEQIDKKGRKRTDDETLKEFYELKNFLDSYDLLHLVINARKESWNQGYGDGYQEGANDMIGRMPC